MNHKFKKLFLNESSRECPQYLFFLNFIVLISSIIILLCSLLGEIHELKIALVIFILIGLPVNIVNWCFGYKLNAFHFFMIIACATVFYFLLP